MQNSFFPFANRRPPQKRGLLLFATGPWIMLSNQSSFWASLMILSWLALGTSS